MTDRPALTRRRLLAAAGGAAALPALGLAGPARARIVGTEGTAYRRMIGEVEVTAILDGYFPLDTAVLLNIDEAAVDQALEAARLPRDWPVPTGIAALLIRSGGELMLVDTGAPASFGPDVHRLVPGLAAAGVAPEDIPIVFITHLHPDHIGGMLEDDAPVFPNAEVRVAQAELDFWTDEGIAAQAPAEAQPFFELARAVVAAYGDRVSPFTGTTELARGLFAEPLPGHTPGHAALRFESVGAQLYYWTDVVHLAAVQFPNPGASLAFDVDPEQAAQTRREVYDMAAADGLLVAGAHLPFPTFGYVAPRQSGFAWEPERWQYR